MTTDASPTLKWLLWRRSLRGPSPILLIGTAKLAEVDQKTKLCDPIKLPEEHLELSLAELIPLYPAPEDETNETPALVVKLA